MNNVIKNILQCNMLRYGWWSVVHKKKEQQYRAAFVEAMNQTAKRFGMTNSHYNNPSGLNEHGKYCMTTARDLCILTNAARKNKKLCSYYAKSYEITRHVPVFLNIETTRKKGIVAKIAQSEINGNPILLEKTGGGDTHYSLLMAVDIKGKLVCGAISEALDEEHRYPAMCELITGVEQILEGESVDIDFVKSARCACAYVIDETKGDEMQCIYEQKPDEVYPTMSTAKMMNMFVAIDYLEETRYTTITPYDVEGTGIGDFLYRWDRISVKDLIYLCLLPSCCVAANAVARIVGRKIYESKKQ